MPLAASNPFPQFFDLDGSPLDGGRVWIGQPGQNPETAPKAAFWDAGATMPAAQPLATLNGYIARTGAPAQVFVEGDYSIAVRNRRGELVVAAPSCAALSNDVSLQQQIDLAGQTLTDLSGSTGTALVGHIAAGAGAVARTAQSKLREIVSSADIPSLGSRCLSVGAANFQPGTCVGVENIAVGYNCLQANTTGYASIAIGVDALKSNTTGGFGIAIGAGALKFATTPSENIALGTYSSGYVTTGFANVGLGTDTHRYLTTGNNNVAAGTQALYNNVTGSLNTAVGSEAARGEANPPDEGPGTGPSPAFIAAFGARALHSGAGAYNTALGFEAGYQTTGSYNTHVGAEAGFRVTSGTNNIFLGYNAGASESQAPGAQSCVAIGDNTSTTGNNAVAIGSGVTAAANQVVLGNATHTETIMSGGVKPRGDNAQTLGAAGVRWNTIYAGSGTINTSDEREKQDAGDIPDEWLDAWAAVEWQRFRFREAVQRKGSAARWHIGLIAQQVEAAFWARGLSARAIGLLCLDQWSDETGTHSRWGLRYDEALALEAALMRRTVRRLQQRLGVQEQE